MNKTSNEYITHIEQLMEGGDSEEALSIIEQLQDTNDLTADERFTTEWITAAEGKKFADIVSKTSKIVKK